MYTRLLLIEFILILSPKSAPPVFRFEGSTDTTAICLSPKSTRKRRTSSSTSDDFPEPPVPVIPNTGIDFVLASSLISFKMILFSSGKFSAAEIARAMEGIFFTPISLIVLVIFSPTGKSHC